MLKLKSLLDKSSIVRTPVNINYTDDTSSIIITTSLNCVESEIDIKIKFNTVAKATVTSLYFPESNYKNYIILDEGEESGFYQIIDYDDKDNRVFDPKGNLNLKMYLVYGYDSYIEVLCSSFEIEYIENNITKP